MSAHLSGKQLDEMTEAERRRLSLSPLNSEPSSMFSKMGVKLIRRAFEGMKAEVLTVPTRLPSSGGQSTAGVILTRQGNEFGHVYIPIKGALLLFNDNLSGEVSGSAGDLLSWKHLEAETQFRMMLGCGRPAGVLEYAIQHFSPHSKWNQPPIEGYRALSVLALPGTVVAKVRESSIYPWPSKKRLNQSVEAAKLYKNSHPIREEFLNRIVTSLSLRFGTVIHHENLKFSGLHVPKLAWVLSEHHACTKKDRMNLSATRAAWFLGGVPKPAALEAIDTLTRIELGGKRVCWPDVPGSKVLRFVPKAMDQIYEESMRRGCPGN